MLVVSAFCDVRRASGDPRVEYICEIHLVKLFETSILTA